MNKITLEKREYMGWRNCLSLSNGTVELIITTDVGPRVIHYGFLGGPNEFCVWEEQAGLTGSEEWRCYGGSRLWHGPEVGTRCYEPDNAPVEYEATSDGVILRQAIEANSRIRKETRIALGEGSEVKLDYQITNTGPWDAHLCIWVLTLMRAGGTLVVPLSRPVRGIAPNAVLPSGAWALWPYSTLADRRLSIQEDYLFLRQDPSVADLFKLGLPIPEGWAAYINDGHMFVKSYKHIPNAVYPDFDSAFEMFCCERFMEVETLSPMEVLGSGQTLHHSEVWRLFDGVQTPFDSESANRLVRPWIGKISD